jgi:hypothetical protein
LKNTQISNFIKFHPVGAEVPCGQRTDRHDKANSRLLQCLKMFVIQKNFNASFIDIKLIRHNTEILYCHRVCNSWFRHSISSMYASYLSQYQIFIFISYCHKQKAKYIFFMQPFFCSLQNESSTIVTYYQNIYCPPLNENSVAPHSWNS